MSGEVRALGQRVVSGLAVAALALTACGGDDQASDTTADRSDVSTTSSSAGDAAEWCDDLSALMGSGEIDTSVIDGAPAEIQAPLRTLAEGAELDPASAPVGTLERFFRANAEVEAWNHDHCDGDHPFCSLWVTATGAIASSALTDAPPGDDSVSDFVDEIDGVLTDHVPSELEADLDTVLASLDHSLSGEEERAAEAAFDALDGWTEEHCAAASPLGGS